MIEIKEYNLNIGVKEPFSVLHISDNHLCYADERDDEEKLKLCNRRLLHFTNSNPDRQEQISNEIFSYARENNLPVIHTGDLIDFVSYLNLDRAEEYLDGINTVMCAGNHEFSLYVGEAKEDEAYKQKSLALVQSKLPDGIEYGVHYLNCLKFITLDDSYYYILPEHFELFKQEVSDGEPFALVVHNPIYSKDLYNQVMNGKPFDEPPYLTGCPKNLLKNLSVDRFEQQNADKTTLEFVEFLNECKNLKAIFAGHLHESGFISKLDSGVPQLVAAGTFDNTIYKVNFI